MQEEGSPKDVIVAVLEVIAMGAALLLLPICLIDLVFDADLLSVFVVAALIAVVATAGATVISIRRTLLPTVRLAALMGKCRLACAQVRLGRMQLRIGPNVGRLWQTH